MFFWQPAVTFFFSARFTLQKHNKTGDLAISCQKLCDGYAVLLRYRNFCPIPLTTNVKNVILQKTTIFSAFALLLLGSGCSKSNEYPEHHPNRGGEVYIRAYQNGESAASDASTKTVIGGEALDKTFWTELDQIMIYYRPADNADPLSSQPFSFYRPYPDETLFSATMPAQPEASYAYYGAYPIPESIDGTRVTYTLPATQDGSYDMRNYDITDPATHSSYKGNLDIMIAEPRTAPALQNGEALGMNFHHQCHVLRVQVPTGRNQWGENVRKLRIEFPTAVVGKMELDLTDPAAAPLLTEGSNTINIELKKPLIESEEDAVDGCYVWVFLCPTTVNGTIRFTAFDENGYQSNSLTTTVNKTMAAGAITPITLTVPDELPVTWIDFSITGNNLGENPNSFTVTAPEGATFRNGTNEQTFTVNSSNTYSLGFYNEIDGVNNGDLIRNGTTTITYDSEHAVVSEERQLAFTPNSRSAVNLTVPYLFFEDFSNAAAQDETNDTKELDAYNLPGWSGSRFGLQANTSAMILGYLGSSILTDPDGGDNHRGRLDTPLLSGLKEGANVSLRVSYDVGGTKKDGNTIFGKTTVMYAQYGFGTDTKSGALSGDDTSIENVFIDNEEPGTDGSYTNLPVHRDVTVTNCTNRHRLSWRASFRVNGQGISTITAGRTYIYIDNIKVSIIP